MTLNLDTGKVLWDTQLSQMPDGDATVSNDLIFTTAFDGSPAGVGARHELPVGVAQEFRPPRTPRSRSRATRW